MGVSFGRSDRGKHLKSAGSISILQQQTAEVKQASRGDAIRETVVQLDADGEPTGNRFARRVAARLLAKRRKGGA